MTTLTPKYNMARNPVYQVDCSFGASGKKVAATKRRIRFRFGFSNAEALAEGATGTACRGEEHEVTLTWSLTSGKRIVMADGVEVHYSKGPRAETKFETSWTMNGQHTIKLIAHAAPPLRVIPGFRQFDLQLDGLSYFDMPKIYELGIKTNQMVPAIRSFAEPPVYNNYSLPEQYERPPYEQPEYGRHRYVEDRREPERLVIKEDVTLRSPTSVMDGTESSLPQDLVSDVTPVQGFEDLIASPVYASAPSTTYDEFTPVQQVEQPRSAAVIHNEILSAYGMPQANSDLLALTNGEQVPPPAIATPSFSSAANMPATSSYGYASPAYAMSPPQNNSAPPQYFSATQYNLQSTPQCAKALVESAPAVVSPPTVPQQLSMNVIMDAPIEEEPVDEMDRALKNLVNIDDIANEIKAPEQKKVEEKRAKNMNKGKSKPLPPTTPSWHLGMKPALNDIKANAPARGPPSKEIMRTHAFDPLAAQAGMMVLYGSPQISSPGFGIPVQIQQQQQYYMYAQQQQQQMYAAY